MIKSVEFVLYGYAVPGLEDRVVREASYIEWYSSCLVSRPNYIGPVLHHYSRKVGDFINL